MSDHGTIIAPDPGLTLSECVNLQGALLGFLRSHRAGGDAVLESAYEKLRQVARVAGEQHPEAFRAIQAEVEMQERFGGG